MKKPLDLHTDSLSKIYGQHFWPFNTEAVRALTPSDLDVLHKRFGESEARWALLRDHQFRWLFGFSAVASLGAMLSPLGSAETFTGWALGFMLVFVCALLLTAFFGGAIVESGYHATRWTGRALTPLSADADDCAHALKLVQALLECRAYRDQVVGSGRELLDMDLSVMRKLEELVKAAEAQEARHQACQQLHGISA